MLLVFVVDIFWNHQCETLTRLAHQSFHGRILKVNQERFFYDLNFEDLGTYWFVVVHVYIYLSALSKIFQLHV